MTDSTRSVEGEYKSTLNQLKSIFNKYRAGKPFSKINLEYLTSIVHKR